MFLHSHYVDQILGTQAASCPYVEEVDPQQLMFLLFRGVRARGWPERVSELELEIKISDKENWFKEQMISTIAAAYRENIFHTTFLPLSSIDLLIPNSLHLIIPLTQ